MTSAETVRVHVLYESSSDGLPHGCSYIRLLRPLSHPSVRPQLLLTQGLNLPMSPVDVLIVERMWDQTCDWQRHQDLLRTVRMQGARIVFEIDDDLLSLNLEVGKCDRPNVTERMWVRQMIRFSDVIVVSTPRLSERLGLLNPRIEIVVNALDDRLFEHSRQFRVRVPSRDIIVFGYMGTFTHLDDLMSIIQPLRSVLERYRGRVRFEIVGIGDCDMLRDAFNNLPVSFLTVPPHCVPYEKFTAWMQENIHWDFGIAPLHNSAFTRSKSDIKFLDYGVQGIPGIYTDAPAYNKTVKHLLNGILATNAHSWEIWLEKMILDDQLRATLAEQAHGYTWAGRMLDTSATNWLVPLIC